MFRFLHYHMNTDVRSITRNAVDVGVLVASTDRLRVTRTDDVAALTYTVLSVAITAVAVLTVLYSGVLISAL